ncbi:unnamed protein product [Pleuronectes platessa]|uniref:Uncharacterized protein n=1 Tax=Pleuronectes platessa TaxID=8262 RepID=A0A9N7VGL1_PLEPL|nr:unnamed protein product [Pleuronectes platessa]
MSPVWGGAAFGTGGAGQAACAVGGAKVWRFEEKEEARLLFTRTDQEEDGLHAHIRVYEAAGAHFTDLTLLLDLFVRDGLGSTRLHGRLLSGSGRVGVGSEAPAPCAAPVSRTNSLPPHAYPK